MAYRSPIWDVDRSKYKTKKGVGYALDWLEDNQYLIDKFADELYISSRDEWYFHHFTQKNPIQVMKLLEDYKMRNEEKVKQILKEIREEKSKIIFIIGGRGSGKTALAFYLAEQLRYEVPVFSCGLSTKALPKWCKYVEESKDASAGGLILFDETAITFSARDFQKEANKFIGKQIATARHNNQTMLFLCQSARMVDVNIRRLKDIILWKRQSTYTTLSGSTYSKSEKFWEKLRNMMVPVTKKQVLFEYPMKRRFIKFEHDLPECWSEELSKGWKDWAKKQPKIIEKIESKEDEFQM